MNTRYSGWGQYGLILNPVGSIAYNRVLLENAVPALLSSAVFRRRHSRLSFEQAGKVLGILESQLVCDLAYRAFVQCQFVFRRLNHSILDMFSGIHTRFALKHGGQIVGR